MAKKRELTPEEKEARRQRQLAILKIAREVCFEKMMKGEIQIFHFHYKRLGDIFQLRNFDVIEKGDGQVSLEDFLQRNHFSSRAISSDGYTSLSRNVLYCGLTVLGRIGHNYIFELTGEWANSFPKIFDFDLEPIEAKIKKMEQEWLQGKLCTDTIFAVEYYGENE